MNGAAALARKVEVVAIIKAYDDHPRERTALCFALITLRPVKRRLSDESLLHLTTFCAESLPEGGGGIFTPLGLTRIAYLIQATCCFHWSIAGVVECGA